MSLRIVREKIYVPLPISIVNVLELYGARSFALPLGALRLSEDNLSLLRLGVTERGLVVSQNDLSPSELNMVVAKFNECHDGKEMLTAEMVKSLDNCVLLSARYKVRTDGNECRVVIDKFEYLDFVLCWHKGRFLPSGKQQRLDAVRKLLSAAGILKRHSASNEELGGV